MINFTEINSRKILLHKIEDLQGAAPLPDDLELFGVCHIFLRMKRNPSAPLARIFGLDECDSFSASWSFETPRRFAAAVSAPGCFTAPDIHLRSAIIFTFPLPECRANGSGSFVGKASFGG